MATLVTSASLAPLKIVKRVLVVFTIAAVLAGAWLAPLDAPALRQVDAGLKRALVSFAAARVLNAVISVAQGTEASVQPFGLGVTLAPGQVLDPVNDLIEQFSQLMLAASVAFGVQKVLIGIGSYWPVSLALSVAVLGWLACHARRLQPPAWLARALVILLMLRFAVPLVTLGSDLLWQKFLAADYAASQQAMDSASGQVGKLGPPGATPAANPGLLDGMKAWLSKNADVNQQFDKLKQAAEQVTLHVIQLIVVFLLQTVVLPLLLLWAFYGLVRRVLEWPGYPPQALAPP